MFFEIEAKFELIAGSRRYKEDDLTHIRWSVGGKEPSFDFSKKSLSLSQCQ